MQGFSPRALGLSGGPAVDFRRSVAAPWSEAEAPRLLAVIPIDPWYVRGLAPTLSSRAYAAAKRVIDIVVSLLSLPVVIPILLLCAIAIRVDSPGKAFFSQLRTGRGGHRFRMFKLRTMRIDAETRTRDLVAADFKPKTSPNYKNTPDEFLT